MTYFPLAQDMIGTPGTLRILLFKSRSFAAVQVRKRKTVDDQGTYWRQCKCGVFGSGPQCTSTMSAGRSRLSWGVSGSMYIVGIGALVVTGKARPPFIPGN
jgi:hypothetical protein